MDAEVKGELNRLEDKLVAAIRESEDRIVKGVQASLADLKVNVVEISRKQACRDETCATERANNKNRDDKLKELEVRADEHDACTNSARIARLEWLAKLLIIALGLLVPGVLTLVGHELWRLIRN